jgi:hypothetical protein
MMTDPYATLPELYDLEHRDFGDDVALYLRLAEVVGDPMLARASDAIAGAELTDRVQLVHGEMTAADTAPGGPFGLVIFSLNGLLHLSSQREQRLALMAARRALDPRGMLVIDTLNPVPELLASFDGRVSHEGSWPLPDGARVDRFAARTHAPATQRIETDLWYDIVDPHGALRRVRTAFPMRYLAPAELELLLELSGFVEWKLYGSYDLDPFEDGSERLIVTAEVTPSRTGAR